MQKEVILSRLAAIEKELKKRREGERNIAQYNKTKKHAKQLAFHRCKKRNRWVFGGNRSGKTECGAVECLWILRGIHPYRKNRKDTFGWAVSLSTQVQRDVAQAKILKYLPKSWISEIVMLSGRRDSPSSGVIDQIKIKNVFGGISTLGFKSCDQGREKFQGSSLDFVWFDEEPPQDIYEECVMRIADRKGDIFGTMTPLLGLTFVYKRIYLNCNADPEVWHIFMERSANPYLDGDEVAGISAAMSDDELNVRRYGRFTEAKGAVYTEFDERTHVIPPFDIPRDWQDRLSIDPGLNNPLSCHWYAVDYDGNVYVVAEHFEAGKPVAHHAAAIKNISARLGWHTDGRGRLYALIDSAAAQHTLNADKSVAELFCENGILADTRVNKDLFSGINRVKQYLSTDGKPRIFIFDTCVNLIRELKSYRWGDGDRPVKTDDHCLDELRYYLMSRPAPPRRAEVKSEIALDKERLIRRVTGRRRA